MGGGFGMKIGIEIGTGWRRGLGCVLSFRRL